jgi:hypothetical protein
MDNIEKSIEELDNLVKDAHITAQDFRNALDRIEAAIRYWELQKLRNDKSLFPPAGQT